MRLDQNEVKFGKWLIVLGSRELPTVRDVIE